ncbi:DUF6913 domain-containing protein [Bacteroidota bacterium]
MLFRSYIDKIKYFILSTQVKKKKRSQVVINLEKAKFIKVFCQIDNSGDYNSMITFLEVLEQKKVSFSVLCFVNDTENITGFGNNSFTKRIICMNPRKTKFFGKKEDELNSFLNEPCDIFVDLCLKDSIAIDYISGLTTASFKVGSYSRTKKYHDLLIDVKDTQNIKYLSEQILHYLVLINPSTKNT